MTSFQVVPDYLMGENTYGSFQQGVQMLKKR